MRCGQRQADRGTQEEPASLEPETGPNRPTYAFLAMRSVETTCVTDAIFMGAHPLPALAQTPSRWDADRC